MNEFSDAPAIIKEFLTYMLTIMGRSPLTVKEYYLDLRTFFRFILKSRKLVPLDVEFDAISIVNVDLELVKSVSRTEIMDFLMFAASQRPKYHKNPELGQGNGARTRARKVVSLRSFYKYCCLKQRYFDENPTAALETPKQRKTLPRFLSLQESLDLLGSVDGPYRERDYAILTIFLNCGLRVSELSGINISDVGKEQLRVVGKGNKERVVYLNDACLSAIDAYIPHRIAPHDQHKQALFISKQGKRINVQTIKWLVKKHLSHAGLESKHCSAHKLRHTAATLMYQNGVDVRVLKEVLGHEGLDTTMIYTHVIDKSLQDAANANPLSAIKPPIKKNAN